MHRRARRGSVPRSRALGAGLLTGLVLLAGCGQASTPNEPETGAGSAPDLARGAWLLRADSYVGADGETTRATYVLIHPADGTVRSVRMPDVSAGDGTGEERTLLVDAGHRFALSDTTTSDTLRRSGQVQVTALLDGSRSTVDLRKATGDPRLTTDHVAFDADVPGQLRVVSGRAVWVVDLGTSGRPGEARKEGEIPITDSWIFGGFAPDTGDPFLSSIASFKTVPRGYGEMDPPVAVRRGDGRVLTSETTRLPGQPADDSCEQVTGFVEKGDRAWEFCLSGTSLAVKVRAAGRTSWQTVGPPVEDAVPAESSLAFVLPPA